MHMRNDVNALSRTVDLAGEAPDAVLFIGNHRLLFGIIPSHYVDKTSFDAGLTAGAFFQIDLNAGTHAASNTELTLQFVIDGAITNSF
jgi:hypothetical protein